MHIARCCLSYPLAPRNYFRCLKFVFNEIRDVGKLGAKGLKTQKLTIFTRAEGTITPLLACPNEMYSIIKIDLREVRAQSSVFKGN